MEKGLANGWGGENSSDDATRCLDTTPQALTVESDLKWSFRLRRADGEYRWVFYKGTPRFA